MSYVIDLVRLQPDVDPDAAYRKQSKATEEELRKTGGDQGLIDPGKEHAKQQLARALVTSHPTLRIAQPDFAELARVHSIDIPEAKRRFRNVELNEERYSIQITLFDDAAGVSFSFSGAFEECKKAATLLWDCLEIICARGGFSAFDPQVDKLLSLDSDFDLVLKTACGRQE
ncbi:MAG: hypothetical protein ABJE10_17955 [bacterium]